MLCLKNIDIHFNDRIVFDQTNYFAEKGKINIIQGESGSGKSTLIQTLLFRYPSQYEFNGTILSDMNEADQSEFIFNKIAVVYQEPLFIDSLKIKDNIEFIKKLYKIENNQENLLSYLQIDHLLDKYPGELSGGEKTRIAIFIAFLKSPEILILDEPTASLDVENKLKVINVLQEIAKTKVVICSTHDSALLNIDSYKTIINNKKLINSSIYGNRYTKSLKDVKTPSLDPWFIIKKEYRNHPVLKTGRIVFLGFVIVLMFISQSLNNTAIDSINERLNDLSSREMIIYKPLFSDFHYIYDSETFPFTDEEINSILDIKDVDSISPRLDIYVDGNYFYSEYDAIFNQEYLNEMGDRYFTDMSRTTIQTIDSSSQIVQSVNEPFSIQMYSETADYSDLILSTFHDEGIYVSEHMAGKLMLSECDGPILRLQLPVPMYNCSGVSMIADPDSDPENPLWIPRNKVICCPVEVNLPVKGIIKCMRSDLLIPESFYINQIQSIPKIRDIVNVYFIRETGEYFIDALPAKLENEEFTNDFGGNVEMKMTSWKPSAYTIICDDLGKIESLKSCIEGIGFKVDNDYYDSQVILTVQESTKKIMILISSFLALIVFGALFIIQYVKKDDIVKIDEYLRINGLNNNQRTMVCIKNLLIQTVSEIIIAFILYYLTVYLLLQLQIVTIKPVIETFSGIAIVIIITEFLFPYLLRRKTIYDKLQKH